MAISKYLFANEIHRKNPDCQTSILDLFRKGHIEEGAADTSWTGLEG